MMDRRKITIVLIPIIVVSSVLVFVIMTGPLHFEKHRSLYDDRYLFLSISGVEDTEIFMRFSNDSTLVYSMDVVFYDDGRATHNTVDIDGDLKWTFIFSGGDGRVKQVNITFGNGIYIVPTIGGKNISIYALINNNAMLRGQQFDFGCFPNSGSSLNFLFTEDVDFTDQGLSVTATDFTTINLIIDLPEGLQGYLTLGDGAYSVYEMEGWVFGGFGRYSTHIPVEQPLLSVTLSDFGHASIYLYD